MSFSSTVPMRRKRTITERITQNGDPLVVKKKAREAAKEALTAGEAPSTTKKVSQL